MSMNSASWWKRYGWLLAIGVCLPIVPLVVVGLTASRFAELEQLTEFHTTVAENRFRLIRVATQLEMAIEASGVTPELEQLKDDSRVRDVWLPTLLKNNQRLYAAIVDPAGQIIVHSEPKSEGHPLGIAWYDTVVQVAGVGVVKVPTSPLSPDRPAYDVRVPIFQKGKVFGELHSGLSAESLDRRLERLYWEVMQSFLVPTFLATGIAGLAYLALAQLAIANKRDQRVLTTAIAERSRELQQIAVGLAHQIRNPLHAIRLNLHVLSNWYSRKSLLSPEDLASILTGSSEEIDRVEQIIRDLLRYTIPEHGQCERVNLATELQSTANLMREDLKRKETELVMPESLPATWVNVDSSSFRQTLIHLITFAQNNAGSKGRINVVVTHRDTHCELDITDNGSTLSEIQRAHLFEPFQATQPTGSSLGMALVKSTVERAGGSIQCIDHSPKGNSIRMRLPRQTPLSEKRAS
ncbi:MAG: HAMP domain-containing sensor histidine kinase [Planctomycetaceae bacterium]